MTDIEILSKIGQTSPGFLVAAFVYLQGRRDREAADLERQREREAEREREREHQDLLVDMNTKLLDTINANTRAIASFEATQQQLSRAMEAINRRARDEE